MTQSVVEPRSWRLGSWFIGAELNDLDGDGDLDVGGLLKIDPSKDDHAAAVFRNRLRHIESPSRIKIGQPLNVSMIAGHDHTLHLGVAVSEVRIPIGGWGVFRLDPATMVLLPGMRLRNRVPGSWRTTVPNSASLPGVVLRFQALDVPPSASVRLTGLSRTLIVK